MENKPVISIKIDNPDYTTGVDCPFRNGDLGVCQLTDFILPKKAIECPTEDDDSDPALTLWKVPADCPLRYAEFKIELGELDKQ
jgi:hypothetical protein